MKHPLTPALALLATLSLALVVSFTGQLHAQANSLKSGKFISAGGHETSGGVSIAKTEDGFVVVLAENFTSDGAPDPKVGLGKDGYDKSAKLGRLTRKTGKQVYQIPAHLNPNDFNEVWIWCEEIDVALGVASLK